MTVGDRTISAAWIVRPSDAEIDELRNAGLDALLERAAGLPRGTAKQFSSADRESLKAALGEAMEHAESIVPMRSRVPA
ncbi:hypothetical protein ACFO8O_10670 [Hephaestia sp. GCM10023244]|uniref:hypothetical protein n=1 Tax=unclassified Hephaestia TaxID=2631281 RepID=UPI002076FD78|nr:hypothetical protein [Hephaestia sp. MAHUQ-44]MCM8731422.1 hypothetical protein [Hephaestia sp. MAHUQ-44]